MHLYNEIAFNGRNSGKKKKKKCRMCSHEIGRSKMRTDNSFGSTTRARVAMILLEKSFAQLQFQDCPWKFAFSYFAVDTG